MLPQFPRDDTNEQRECYYNISEASWLTFNVQKHIRNDYPTARKYGVTPMKYPVFVTQA